MIKCTFTPKSFEQKVAEKLLSIFENDLSDVDVRNQSYKAIRDISESMGLTGPEKIKQALSIVKNITEFFNEEQQLDDNEIRAALSEWKHSSDQEDASADHLVKDNEKFNDDPLESNYGSALYAKLRAKQQANKVGIRSILYNEEGIINSTSDLNVSIKARQQELLDNVINYLKTRISPENQAKYPDIFVEGKMYIGENYTGIVEKIKDLYSSILGKENFSIRMLNKYYNDGNFNVLDAYSSWIILNNFDTILQQTFGKAISINPDMSKYSSKNKYSIAGGSNVYTTWRTNEEIDLSKEINNISQVIITSLPFIPKNNTSITDQTLKFNEFLYVVGKIKDIPNKAENDWIIQFNSRNSRFSKEFKDSLTGKSFIELINSIRDNPQKILPIVFQLLNDENTYTNLIANKVLDSTYFLEVDKDIINSIYKGLFDLSNQSSLYFIQNKSGFKDINYFSFVCQTIDSVYKSSFLQYFRNPQGKIYVRNMYDQSINNIEYTIRDTINSLNSQMFIQDYDAIKSKYNVSQTNRTFNGEGEYKLYYGGTNYTLVLKDNQITAITSNGYPVTDRNLLDTLISEYMKIPSSISFTIDNFHKGPLKVTVSLSNNDITYEVNGQPFTFTSIKDYESLQDIIQEILKQNLTVDNIYFRAYQNRFGIGSGGTMTSHLMSLVSRVIANQYLSEQFKGKTPVEVRNKLNVIFGENSDIKPIFDKKIKEIKLLTSADTKYILELAEAKAQATGRLTSSQILDSNGNAMASSALSRLVSTLNYQIQKQVRINGAAAQNFSLWNTGVFKGIQQMKEIQDNTTDTSKSQTEFTTSEMEFGTVFIDFLQSLTGSSNSKNPLQNGITAFIPSENSDKTFIGRMLVDLSKLKIGEESIFDIIRNNPDRINEVIPYFQRELQSFYNKALDNINSTWTRVGLLIGENVSYGNWEAINTKALHENKSPLEYINDLITKYNNDNPQNPIVLIDQVHYVEDKNGNLTTNLSFLENINRFNNSENLLNFLYSQNIETVERLIKDGLDVVADENFKKLKHSEDWIDQRTGKIILAKVWEYNPQTGEEEVVSVIRRKNDLEKLQELNSSVSGIEINPLIRAYNTLNYFLTQEFMGSTVGMFYAHPSKDTSNPLNDEKSRKLAQDKRNVSFTASMHSFVKNLIQGIPEEINIAIMSDPKDVFETISGDRFSQKPFDGATFELPWMGEWENNSLGGSRVGINKKTFTHYYDSRTGTGGIIKTANFCLTNDKIRGSKFYQRMIKNMSDRIWRNQDGSSYIGDITHDYDGNLINFSNPNDKDGQLYFRTTDGEGKLHYYRINSIERVGENLYQRHLQEVDSQGRVISEDFIEKDTTGNPISYLVNTNYSLWNLFGGAYAMEYVEGASKLEFSENSIKLVANIANKIGNKLNNDVRTQEDLYQPLKHSDIHWMPTIGAVKQGAGNINKVEAYNVSDSSKINFMKIKLNQSGIQLDKEHFADGEDLSIMTQVLSACAARGFTQEQSQEMYNALASLAKAGIKDYLDAFDEFFQNPNGFSEVTKDKDGNPISTNQKYQQVILDTLVDALSHSTNNDSTIQMVTQELINKAKEGKELSFKEMDTIPYSDPSVFRKLHSTIAVALTRGAIKIKVSGILSVLNPTFGIVKMYGDRTLQSFNDDAHIQALQKAHNANPENELINNLGKIRLGRTYKVQDSFGNFQYVPLITQSSYYSFKDKINSKEFIDQSLTDLSYIEGMETFNGIPIRYGYIGESGGRKIAARAITENGIKRILVDREAFAEKWAEKAWRKPLRSDFIGIIDFQSENDLITWALLHELAHHKFEDNQHQEYDRTSKENRANSYATQNFVRNKPDYNLSSVIEQFAPDTEKGFEGGRDLASYNATFKQLGNNYIYNIYDLASVRELAELKSKKASKTDVENALQKVQHDLMILHKKKGTVKLTTGENIEIDPNSVSIEPYEIVMPKIFATVFGLETSDDLNAIKQDREFFVKRLLERIKPRGIHSSAYTVGLMNISGKHFYLLDRNQGIPNLQNFVQKEIQQYREKNKIWRVRNGEKMYQMQEGDTIWEYQSPDGTMQEVIVSNNINFYLDKLKFITLNVSSKANQENIINRLGLNRKNRAIRNYLEAIDIARQAYGDSLSDAIRNIQNIEFEDINESPIGNYFQNIGHKLHTSLLKSLEVVAARIPAQSMQSFMPMKVVAFEAPDINTAYVGTAHFLFQGSDLDIDAVSIASYSFDKSGMYIGHSPYFNQDTIENLEASLTLPFPTGQELSIGEGYNFDYSWIASTDTPNPDKPFYTAKLGVRQDSPRAIIRLAQFIKLCNTLGYIPKANSSEFEPLVEDLVKIVNNHNLYINNENSEDFSKNYVVSSMYRIGLSPANLIESQQAMDSITGPLKKVANSTIKAKENYLDNPASFVTNIHGIQQNMAGKKGVGICAVGLKSFFALTARYNEVLNNGTEWEQERLKSEVTIAGKKLQMLANAYGTNIMNQEIANIIQDLSYEDQALVLSGLLSLATDNAKELALDKLNAQNTLGMYIYGITIGMDFKTLADIICSNTGLVINEMMQGNVFSKKKGMSIQNIFDYLETAPNIQIDLPIGTRLSSVGQDIMNSLSQINLFELVHKSGLTLQEQFQYLDKIKNNIDKDISLSNQEKQALHRAVEEAEDFIERVNIIQNEQSIYEDFKKLNEGGEELRRQGQLLHINQGLETSYVKSINYIDLVSSVVADRQYSIYREQKRALDVRILSGDEKAIEERKALKSPDGRWKFDFHNFVINKDYREAWIDIYSGIINQEKFINSEIYRKQFQKIFPETENIENLNTILVSIQDKLKPSKVFFNILDTMQISHYLSYLQSADMLHQAMMKTSIKYRSIFNLGRAVINELGAFSTNDKENIYRRTEQFIDRTLRDRYYLSKNLVINIPKGQSYFLSIEDEKVRKNSEELEIVNGLIKTSSSSSITPIQLGTRAGNATFKMLMETKIIPDLQKGRYGKGNNIDPALAENEFIKSLAPTPYKHNPSYTVTINYAPNINMSPRSDADKALFEKIKFAFNEFKFGHLGSIKYNLGGKDWDIIELFYYYNQIAFGGRPGENSMTSIFQDVLDYKPIKEFRDYENVQDKEGVINIKIDSLAREVTLRQNPWQSNLKYIYYEDSNTGQLSLWTKTNPKQQQSFSEFGEEIPQVTINNYIPSAMTFTENEDFKNFVLSSSNIDSQILPITLSDKSQVIIQFDQGRIIKIKVNPWNGSQVDILNGYTLEIPTKYKQYFDNPPTTYIIDKNGNRVLGYDENAITRYIEQLLTCN